MTLRSWLFCALTTAIAFCHESAGSACVWKVRAPSGDGTLYLGGSVHALRRSDYPLPEAYSRALDASSRVAFETDVNAMKAQSATLAKQGEYPKGDSLKNHVDPRTYDYVRRVFALLGVPEQKIAKCRPWLLVEVLTSPTLRGLSMDLGVEGYLVNRARAAKKPMVGLTPVSEHIAVLSGLSDKQAEILLLTTFLPDEHGKQRADEVMTAWRRGDAETIARDMHSSLSTFPSFEQRLLGARNRAWIPKIEDFMRSGKTYFVVVGSAHMGSSDGLLALLRERGYQIEQL